MSCETPPRRYGNTIDEIFCRAYEDILNEELVYRLVPVLKRLRQKDIPRNCAHKGRCF